MSEALAQVRWLPARRARAVVAANGVGGQLPAPLVAVLCTTPRRRVAAAGVALALAHAMRRPFALAAAVGGDASGLLGGTPAAGRAARGLRERGLPASASGRLVWVADRRDGLAQDDDAARVAAMSAELGRSAVAVGAPAAVAIPFPRTAALDRVVAWHDAIVIVREPDAPEAVIARALTSLAELDRPVAAIAPSTRLPSVLAAGGVVAPAAAVRMVAELGFGGAGPGRPDA